MERQAEVVVGALACVAFVAGVRNLVALVGRTGERRLGAMVALVALVVALSAVAAANPEVWPLFVVGFPSLACVVLEGLAHLREVVGRKACLWGARRDVLRGRVAQVWAQMMPGRTARLARRHA